ncbi:DUF4864 domain-containing protein [Faunimonas sp. B44]|uniref:DUF4864 domain-containing protein n=1 Tax=Faunimonas sp. B44 TaxID=3461493 RepID=UPI004043F24C
MRRRALAIIAEPVAAIIACAVLIVGVNSLPLVPQESVAVKSSATASVVASENAPELLRDNHMPVVRVSTGPEGRDQIRDAVSTFVWALSNGQKEAVWSFASEEEQASFKTVDEAFQAVSGAFPPLAYATRINFERIDVSEEVSTATFYVQDKLGLQWRAAIDLVQDIDGEWKIIACDLQPAPGVSI